MGCWVLGCWVWLWHTLYTRSRRNIISHARSLPTQTLPISQEAEGALLIHHRLSTHHFLLRAAKLTTQGKTEHSPGTKSGPLPLHIKFYWNKAGFSCTVYSCFCAPMAELNTCLDCMTGQARNSHYLAFREGVLSLWDTSRNEVPSTVTEHDWRAALGVWLRGEGWDSVEKVCPHHSLQPLPPCPPQMPPSSCPHVRQQSKLRNRKQ